MRGWAASFTASQAASMSPRVARARLATVQRLTALAIFCTLLKSMGEAMAKPASMTSTPSFSSCRAISTFSERFMLHPGDCSPSRKVVSKTLMRLIKIVPPVSLSRHRQQKGLRPFHFEETKA